jgi:hypothetical protein
MQDREELRLKAITGVGERCVARGGKNIQF